MVSARILTIITIVFVLIALILEIVATATTHWVEWEALNIDYHRGLFRHCAGACADIGSKPDYYKATAAFCILGIIFAFVCLLLLILRMFVSKLAGKRIVALVMLITAWVAFVCMLIAIIVFGAKEKNNLNYSYALAVVATIFQLLGAIILTLMHVRVDTSSD